MTHGVPTILPDQLLDTYDAVLLDAYGVLITHHGVIEGAETFVETLNRRQKPYFVLTNDASRSVPNSALRYREMGLEISPEQVITSGSLIPAHFAASGLEGARCVVLGTEDSAAYVDDAGGKRVPLDEDADADVLVVCDERGYPMREALDHVLSLLYRKFDGGELIHLVLANPDLVYPAGPARFGFTAGIVARMLEGALEARYPTGTPRFVPLGKPHSPMFTEAERRSGTRNMIMLGDQLETDILGASRFGIDSALLPTGVTRLEDLEGEPPVLPTFVLPTLTQMKEPS